MGMLNAARTLAIDELGELTTDEETSLLRYLLRDFLSPDQARAALDQFRARSPF
jgi:hypothetical protein